MASANFDFNFDFDVKFYLDRPPVTSEMSLECHYCVFFSHMRDLSESQLLPYLDVSSRLRTQGSGACYLCITYRRDLRVTGGNAGSTGRRAVSLWGENSAYCPCSHHDRFPKWERGEGASSEDQSRHS